MATYVVTADGVDYEIDAPDDMPESDVMKEFSQSYKSQTQEPVAEQAPEVQADPERNWYDPIREIGEGATFGWGDEVGSGIAAGFAKLSGDEKPYGQIYDEMKGIVNDQRKSYTDAYPLESLALNVGGGLLTGGGGTARTMATQGFKNASKLGKTLKLMGLGAAEGSIAGAGAAGEGEGDTIKGAGIGAGVGGLIPALGYVGRKGLDTVSKRRVVDDLVDEAGDFTPINQMLPEGSRLQNFFQKKVAGSYGGQQLRDQNRTVLEKALAKVDESKAAQEFGETTGKKIDERALRELVKSKSLPDYVSPEFLEKIKNADAHEAIKMIDEAWNTGFEVVKNRNFNINPTRLTDEIVDGMDTPMDAQYASQIKALLQKKLKGGFTPNKGDPSEVYSTKGMGSIKNPKVDLEDGVVDGKWLMQARNDFRMQANDLEDAGQSALEVNALKSAASKIDQLIRKNLTPEDLGVFDKELKSWGNFQAGRRGTRNAGITKQGEYTPENILGADKVNQTRNFDVGDASFQKEAQNLQVAQQAKVDALRNQVGIDEKALKGVEGKLPNLNPSGWTESFNTGVLGLPVAAISPWLVPAAGFATGKALSTEAAQKAVAGQTGMQKTIAELLRQFEGSEAQRAATGAQGVLSREAIMNMTGE